MFGCVWHACVRRECVPSGMCVRVCVSVLVHLYTENMYYIWMDRSVNEFRIVCSWIQPYASSAIINWAHFEKKEQTQNRIDQQFFYWLLLFQFREANIFVLFCWFVYLFASTPLPRTHTHTNCHPTHWTNKRHQHCSKMSIPFNDLWFIHCMVLMCKE